MSSKLATSLQQLKPPDIMARNKNLKIIWNRNLRLNVEWRTQQNNDEYIIVLLTSLSKRALTCCSGFAERIKNYHRSQGARTCLTYNLFSKKHSLRSYGSVCILVGALSKGTLRFNNSNNTKVLVWTWDNVIYKIHNRNYIIGQSFSTFPSKIHLFAQDILARNQL